MKKSDINHLRRLLGWVRCDIGQSPAELQQTMIEVADDLGHPEISQEAKVRVVEAYRRAESVPLYVHAAVKALEKVLSNSGHEATANQPETRASIGSEAATSLMTPTSGDVVLPPMKELDPTQGIGRAMQDYARAAVLADRHQRFEWPDETEIERGLAEIGVTVWGQRSEDWLAGANYAAKLLGYRPQSAADNALPCRQIPASPAGLRQGAPDGPAPGRRDVPAHERQDVQANDETAGRVNSCRTPTYPQDKDLAATGDWSC